MYVFEMTRYTRDDWINFGLKILKTEGYSQLKAGSLAKRLNVSRGSFYWHFKDLDAFHAALLGHWKASNRDVASSLGSTLSPSQKLQVLMNAVKHSDFELERAFRAWGRENLDVGLQIDQLDNMRLSVVQSITGQAITDPQKAEARSRFVYAAAVGLMVLGKDKVGVGEAELASLVTSILDVSEA